MSEDRDVSYVVIQHEAPNSPAIKIRFAATEEELKKAARRKRKAKLRGKAKQAAQPTADVALPDPAANDADKQISQAYDHETTFRIFWKTCEHYLLHVIS